MTNRPILVADDDYEINELITMSLRREGYEVIAAYDGHEALNLARTHAPALVILDVLMPGMDGFEICSEIRKTSNIPILFVSCKDEDIDKVLGLRLGGDDFISKPFSPIELVARVKAHIRRNYMLQQSNQEQDTALRYGKLVITRRSMKSCSMANGSICRPRNFSCCTTWPGIRTASTRTISCSPCCGMTHISGIRTPSWCTSTICARNWRRIPPSRDISRRFAGSDTSSTTSTRTTIELCICVSWFFSFLPFIAL